MHEAGRYLSGTPFVAAGPHRQLPMGLPPSVLPLTTVLPVWIGVRLMLLADALVLPRSASWLPTTVITPLASALRRLTYLLAWFSQTWGNVADTSACVAVVMASLTAVLQPLAAPA